MFFWISKLFHVIINSFKASLQSCHKKTDPNKSDRVNNPKRINIRRSKRTFSVSPSAYRASMCLEASISFSFFFLFLTNIFSIIFLFMAYTEDLVLLQQQGKAAAAFSYLAEEEFYDEDICLQKNRVITSLFPILSIPECRLYTQCIVKPWNGYDVIGEKEGDKEEKYVYMTEYGKVYHKSRGCSYLTLSIEATAAGSVDEKRNESGECYYPCEYCKREDFVTVVYITSYGNRYHFTTKCQGIKRTVNKIPFSEAEGIDPCERCGR